MSKKIRLLVISMLVMAMVTMVVGCGSDSKKTVAYPSKSIEIMVPMSAGGGSDVFARAITKLVADKKMISQPMIIVNKPGGAGSIGYSYLAEKKGSAYNIGTVSSSFYATPISGKSPVSYKDFTFICLMAADPLIIMVNSDSKYKTFKELVADAKANPGTLSSAGSSSLSDDAILFNAFVEKAGIDMKYVPFNSGGEVSTAILGNHVTTAFLSPSEALAQMEAKKLRPLAVASKQRLAGFDIPTFIEEGVNISLEQGRGIVGPKDMPDEAVKALQAMFKEISQDPEWKAFMKKNYITGTYMDSAEYTKFAEETHKVYLEYLTKMGAAKK